MNPYTPPAIAIPQDPTVRVVVKNPARFLLFPLGAICIYFSITTGARYLLYGFRFRTVDFLNAGIGVLEVLFGISAFLLATRELSKKTRAFTIIWSLAAVSMLATGVFFNPPSSIQDLILIIVSGSIFLLVGFLAFRKAAQGPTLSPIEYEISS
jgi:hypothetical protein